MKNLEFQHLEIFLKNSAVWHWCISYFEGFFHSDPGISKTHAQHKSWCIPCPLSNDTNVGNFGWRNRKFRRLKERVTGCTIMLVLVFFKLTSWNEYTDVCFALLLKKLICEWSQNIWIKYKHGWKHAIYSNFFIKLFNQNQKVIFPSTLSPLKICVTVKEISTKTNVSAKISLEPCCPQDPSVAASNCYAFLWTSLI